MCYRDDVPPLLLEGVHVACLCGDNGAGKSALFDAITWGLWGRAFRVRPDDDLVHMGKVEMEVELDFYVTGNLYRVVRKRDHSRRPGKTILELQQSSGDDTFVAITGDNVRDTQRRIENIIKMDFDTFVNSAFLVQGRADEFTTRSPDKRKAVLARILGLEYYDRLAERAREQARERRGAIEVLDAAIETLERDLERREEYVATVHAVEEGLAAGQEKLRNAQESTEKLRRKKQAMEMKLVHLEEVERRLKQSKARSHELGRQEEASSQSILRYESVLSAAEAISAEFQELQTVSARRDSLERAASQFLQLTQRKAEAQQTVAAAKADLEFEARSQSRELDELEALAAQEPPKASQLREVKERLASLQELAGTAEGGQEMLEGLAGDLAGLKSTQERLELDGKELLRQKQEIEAGRGECPLCGTKLGDDGYHGVVARYDEQLEEKREGYKSVASEVSAKLDQRAKLDETVRHAQHRLRDEQRPLQASEGSLQTELSRAGQAAERLPELRGKTNEVSRRLHEGLYAELEQAQLLQLDQELGALGYDQVAHHEARADYERLRPAEERYRAVEEARRLLPEERGRLSNLNEEATKTQREIEEGRAQVEGLSAEVAGLPRVAQELEESEQTMRQVGAEVDRLRGDLGAAKRDLERLDDVEQQRDQKRDGRRRAGEEQGIYNELAEAFGRRGVQALIIDDSLPEIEREANGLLARMTDNRMHLKLETQAPSRSGDNIQETLEIKVADELGTRGYETFSGGEAFRVNVALRIALSRLLARRAGAPLPTLFIDEGFGTQDTLGRDRIIDAINAIQDEFERILVITHIDEIKEQFPVRIEVEKTPLGSTFTTV